MRFDHDREGIEARPVDGKPILHVFGVKLPAAERPRHRDDGAIAGEGDIGLVRYELANARTESAVGNLSNRSLAHLEPVSGAQKRKSESGGQRQPLQSRQKAR